MASRGLLTRTSNNSPLQLCRQCLSLRSAISRQTQQTQRRCLSLKVVEKRRLARKAWDEKAELIKKGKAPHLWDIFKERGYVKDIAGTDEQISELMRRERIGAYVGIDPTAPSLHVGHLLPLMALFWMYLHGYRSHTVIGGATAKIGDPTDRLRSRDRLSRATLTTNIAKTHYQLKRIWVNVDAQARRLGYEKDWAWERALFNNSIWYNNLPLIEVVQRLFKGIRLGSMLSRETVKRKMSEGDGMSLDEFIYPLMQAWDWWHMFSSPKPIHMQIGGSDQYGNIVSGIESIKYIRDHDPNLPEKIPDDFLHTPVGFTVPLLTDSSGAKFGKSAGNAVWLDRFMTSTFDLYGYFMRRPDADIENLLKLFTFLPKDEINEVMQRQNQEPSKRHAQHALAYEVVALVHGIDDAEDARARHLALFARAENNYQGPLVGDQSAEVELKVVPDKREPWRANTAARFRPDIQLPRSVMANKSIARILFAAGLAPSAAEANRLTKTNGAYIAAAPGQPSATNKGMTYGDLTFTPVRNWFPEDNKNFMIEDKLMILRRGKHFIRVVEMVSDEEWKASGQTYPGQPYAGQFRLLREALKEAAGGQDLSFKPFELQAILAEVDNIEFKKRLSKTEAGRHELLTYPERRRRGMKPNREHATSVERALMQTPKKLAAAEKMLAAQRGPDALNLISENEDHEEDEDKEYEGYEGYEGDERDEGDEGDEGYEGDEGDEGYEGDEGEGKGEKKED